MTKMARAFAATVSAHGSRCSIAAQLEKAKTARAAKKRETVGHEILGTDPPGSGSPRVVAVPTRGGACTETDISGFARVPAYVMSPTSSSLGRILLLGALGRPYSPRTLTRLML